MGTCISTCQPARFATAFARWQTRRRLSSGSCMQRKGELSPAAIDRRWPYEVALPTRASANGGSVVDKAIGCQSGGALYRRIG
jgi:hypothetical protein